MTGRSGLCSHNACKRSSGVWRRENEMGNSSGPVNVWFAQVTQQWRRRYRRFDSSHYMLVDFLADAIVHMHCFFLPSCHLELCELLASGTLSWQHAQDVESYLSSCQSCRATYSIVSAYSLAERSALSNGDLVALDDTEGGRYVCGEVLVALLVTRVFGHKVQVFTSDDQCAVHLCGNDGTGQNSSTDRDHAGERAFLVFCMSASCSHDRAERRSLCLVVCHCIAQCAALRAYRTADQPENLLMADIPI